jgi:hypothetical protein
MELAADQAPEGDGVPQERRPRDTARPAIGRGVICAQPHLPVQHARADAACRAAAVS